MVALLAGLGFTGTSQAALIDRGNGLLYDNVLNVTWLQDANYAKTSGYSATGQMDWNSANTWAANLNYQGITGWRLASNTPINGSFFDLRSITYNGSTDTAVNIVSPYSELAYMYSVNLGLKASYSTTGANQPNYGIFGNGTYNGLNVDSFGQNNVGLVHNLQSYMYWSGSDFTLFPSIIAPFPSNRYAWSFDTFDGGQGFNDKSSQYSAWAVHPGDVSAVPVPGAVWLFGSGLIGLLSFNRRKNKTVNLIAA